MFKSKSLRKGAVNASYLFISKISAQALSFLSLIYIARELGPNEYGKFSTTVVFVSMFSFLALDGLTKVLVREGSKDVSNFTRLFEYVLPIKLVVILIAFILCIFAVGLTDYTLQIKYFIVLYALTILSNGLQVTFKAVFQVYQEMKYIGYLDLTNRTLYVVFAVLFIYLGYGVVALIIISLLSNIISTLITIYISKRFLGKWVGLKLRFTLDSSILKPAVIFSLIGLFIFMYSRIDILMISWFLGSGDVGLYAVPFRFVEVANFASTSLSVAFFPIFVQKIMKRTLRKKTILKSIFFLFLIISFFCILLSIFSERLILLFLGEKYRLSGTVLAILVWDLALGIPTIPISITMQADNLELYQLFFGLSRATSNVILNLILIDQYGIVGIAMATIITRFLYLIIVNLGFQWRILSNRGTIV